MENPAHQQQTAQGPGRGGGNRSPRHPPLVSQGLTVGLEHAAAHGGRAAVGLPEQMVIGVVRGRAGWLDP